MTYPDNAVPGTVTCDAHDAGMNIGGCKGAPSSTALWLYTVNGQVNPTVEVNGANGEIWNIANIGANASYNLQVIAIVPWSSSARLLQKSWIVIAVAGGANLLNQRGFGPRTPMIANGQQ